MSYFTNAHDFSVGSLNIDAGTHVYNAAGQPQSPRDLLYSKISPGAIHDSDERCDAPKCHPETRKAVQGDIISWIRHGKGGAGEEPMNILWLNGPAGAGKTAIAGSVADACESEGLLAATFFFSSFLVSENRRYKRYLVPTLAYQLAQLDGFEPYEDQLLSVVRRNPAVFDKQLKSQMEVLILKPLRNLRRAGSPIEPSSIGIIDGVDEVEAPGSRQLDRPEARLANEADQAEVLSALSQFANDPDVPFRIVVVSRPERVIRDFFAAISPTSHALILDNKYDPDSDITLFLQAKFAELRRRYRLPASWPSESIMRRLVETASGQFVYAATIIRFLQSAKHPNPPALLQMIMDWRSQDVAIVHDALSPLDALYTQILQSSPDPRLATQWLGVVNDLPPRYSASFVRQLLQDYEGQADHLLENLASILKIPPPEDAVTPYQFYHKSFSDFLLFGRCVKELSDGFLDGMLLWTREVEVLKAKAINVTLAEPEWEKFLRTFIDLVVPGPPKYLGRLHNDLCKCDVVWWVRVIIISPLMVPEEARAMFISRLFAHAHMPCVLDLLNGRNHGLCGSSCKHWRSNILRTCLALGWNVPEAPCLLREKMWFSEQWAIVRGGLGAWNFSNYFFPPNGQQGLSLASPEVEALPHTMFTVDPDYERLLELTDTMFYRLPKQWRSDYREQLSAREDQDMPLYDALPHHVDKIVRELEAEMEETALTKLNAQSLVPRRSRSLPDIRGIHRETFYPVTAQTPPSFESPI